MLSLSLGCGHNVYVRGKVTFSDDNSPVPNGTVNFETDTFIARGYLKSDGMYTVGSLSTNDGLPSGLYKVSITGAEKEIGIKKDGDPIMELLIDKRYTNNITSGLTFEVTPASKIFNITVDRFVPTKGKQKKNLR
jgi:flagellar hook assembly protein FlgD